ncbi:MAG: hypothetical protein JWP24_2609, partial [Marmoricola sp.]|nr:hypothetical protein [Marmoricola sp.]
MTVNGCDGSVRPLVDDDGVGMSTGTLAEGDHMRT